MFRPLGVIFRSSLGTYFYITFLPYCFSFALCITSEISKDGTQFISTVSTYAYKCFIAVAEVHVAGPYSWVTSGGGYCTVCVILFAAIFVFLLVSSLVFESIL